MKKKDGGTAFPIQHKGFNDSDNHITYVKQGMSLRDYFAAKAMQAFLSCPTDQFVDGQRVSNGYATAAYRMADLMLKAREDVK